MAAVTRHTDRFFNRCRDVFPTGRAFCFFKERFNDDVETEGGRFIVICETDDSTQFLSDPGGPGIDADWDEWERINSEADFDIGVKLTPPEVREFNVLMFWTWILRRRLRSMLSDVIANGYSVAQRRRAFVGAMVAAGVDFATANSLSSGVTGLPSLDAINFPQLNLNNVPRTYREKLRAQAD